MEHNSSPLYVLKCIGKLHQGASYKWPIHNLAAAPSLREIILPKTCQMQYHSKSYRTFQLVQVKASCLFSEIIATIINYYCLLLITRKSQCFYSNTPACPTTPHVWSLWSCSWSQLSCICQPGKSFASYIDNFSLSAYRCALVRNKD